MSVRIIEPRAPGTVNRLGEFWRHRALARWFGMQMLEKLYRRTWLGWIWVPLRPLLTVVSSAFVFGGLLGVSSGDVPYALFFLFTVAAWDLFSFTLLWGTRSIELGRRVLRRMYAPRLTCLVGALVISGTLFGIYAVMGLALTFGYVIFDGHMYLAFGTNNLALPAALVLIVLLALSVACFTSPFAVRARDVRFAVGYGLGFWMVLSPVIYPLSQVPDRYRTITQLNPMTAPLELFRIGLFDQGQLPTLAVASCLISTVVLVVAGLWFFNRSETRTLDAM